MTRRRLAIVGDTHADEHSRFDEHNRVMAWITLDAAGRRCNAMVHTGDVYERTSTPREREAVASWVYGVTMRMPLVIVAGNHDNERDIELLGRLQTGGHRVHAMTRPGWCDALDTGGFWIGCLPWPRKAGLLRAHPDVSHEQADQVARLALTAILRDLGNLMQGVPDMPRVFAGHVMMRGSRVSVSQPPLVGMDLELSLADLALVRAVFYALGHIHLGQQWHIEAAGQDSWIGDSVIDAEHNPSSAPVVYPGSPRRCNFGEVEPKGYVVAEFEGSELVGWERVATPCAPMLHVEGDFIPAHDDRGPVPAGLLLSGSPPTDAEIREAEVRVRYRVSAEHRVEARAVLAQYREQLLAQGAALVKVEERVRVASRARVPEIAKALTLEQKLEAYWQSQGPKAPDAEQRARLRLRLAELGVAS